MASTDSRDSRSALFVAWLEGRKQSRFGRADLGHDKGLYRFREHDEFSVRKNIEKPRAARVDVARQNTTGRSAENFHAEPRSRSRLQAVLKRSMDLVGSVLGLVLLAPIFLVAATAIFVTNPGPVLFRQKRYGLDGKLITVYKFRTMRVCDGDESGVQQTVADDPRVTKVGAFLRKTSIDELPQLWNVLLGNMSLVGPRPHVPNMLANGVRYEDFDPRYMDRCSVLPGITGLAQVKGFRGPTDDERSARMRLEYDLKYIREQSFLLDVKLIIATLKSEFLTGSGS